jgi:hypothetical protein
MSIDPSDWSPSLTDSSLAESCRPYGEVGSLTSIPAFKNYYSVRLVFLRKNQGARIGDFQPRILAFAGIHEACDHPGCLIEVDHGQDITLIIENKSSEETGPATICLYLYDLGSRWQIENALHANHEEIPPKGSNQADEDNEDHPAKLVGGRRS